MLTDVMTERLAVPAPAQILGAAFRDAGEELFLVGGPVRDALLGKEDADLDFATSALPAVTIEILAALGVDHPYRIGEKYGTIGARFDARTIEITTYRSGERYAPGTRKPEVEFGRTLAEDLKRRDFTINAMAQDPATGHVIDPFNGRLDLARGVVRAVGNPEERFSEDPLRLLRAVRFAARFDFAVEPATWSAMRRVASSVESISRERIRDEYSRIIAGEVPSRGLTLLRDSGLLATTCPPLLELTAMPDHGPRHPLSLWEHTMRVVDAVRPVLELRWAALLHDIAKPVTRTHEPDGRPRFFHHEEVGAGIAGDVLRGLRYPNQVVADVTLLVETHMQLHAYTPEWSDGAIRRLMLRLGPLLPLAIDLARSDAGGHSPSGRSENSPRYDAIERRIMDLEQQAPRRLESPLTGEDLMQRYGRPPGPWIRTVKDALRDEVVEERLGPDDREAAWLVADRVTGGLPADC